MNPNVPPPGQLNQLPSSTEALRSVHTSNLPEIFKQLQISLVISTYQAGKVILVRADGATLNTHFCAFGKPMGIAADHSRLTIGGTNTVWYYRNVPAVAAKLEPQGKHDPVTCPGASMSPATSTSMRWPTTATMSCGWSTRASVVSAPSTPSTAPTPAGAHPSSALMPPRTAVT